ncbi:hypothetical protein THC_0704 [Caldimicrobium thiodismutans]|uniref:Caspase family p20 domain-containing protein n=1 Tax=Caldimicrobium thiodismutans TaxID=1653476 RepID=A0A0U5AV21_9BACT|nr:caspase family protein [Caldimicrobium thiodismutans]BAU23096.1 hypothetical protein THC_0704 [Caldimicrobium thiodismutans]
MKKLSDLQKYKFFIFVILTILSISYFSKSIAYDYDTASQYDEVKDRINEAFNKAGIFEAYVQLDEKTRMYELKGKYRTYDEFLYAYMIAQAIAGVKNVSPVYSIKHAVIIHTPIERCLPYALLKKPCPHLAKKDYKEDSQAAKEIEKKLGEKPSNKYALVIGVSSFKNKQIPGVPGADNDALIWGKYLESEGFKVIYLLNENATKEKVNLAVDEIIKRMKENDIFVFFAASHGTPKKPDGEVGIVLYDSGDIQKGKVGCGYAPPNEPHLQAANKMCYLVKDSFSLKEGILDKLANKKVVFIPILDACYSGDALRSYLGEVIKSEEVAPLDFYEKRLREEAPASLYMVLSSSSGFRQAYGADVRSFTEVEKVFKRSISEVPFTAKDIKKESELAHGIFSFYFVNGLKLNEGYIARTYNQVKDIIDRESERVCLKERGRSIRVISECPKGGQNPVLLRIRKEEFKF